MDDGHRHVRCGISRLALEVLQPELPPTKEGRMQAFQQHRRRIERAASAKFDRGQLEPDGSTVSELRSKYREMAAFRAYKGWSEGVGNGRLKRDFDPPSLMATFGVSFLEPLRLR